MRMRPVQLAALQTGKRHFVAEDDEAASRTRKGHIEDMRVRYDASRGSKHSGFVHAWHSPVVTLRGAKQPNYQDAP